MASSRFVVGPGRQRLSLTLGICIGGVGFPTDIRATFPEQNRLPAQAEPFQPQPPSFARMLQDQAETDRVWRAASAGYMQMDEDHLPQQRRRPRHPGVRVSAADPARRKGASGASSGSTRTFAGICTNTTSRTSGKPLPGATSSSRRSTRQHRLRQGVLRRDRLRRRRGGRRGDGRRAC